MTGDTLSSTHPLLPPTTEDTRVAWLRLLRSRRVGIATFYRMMADHGSAEAALDALPELAHAAGVANYRPCSIAAARAELHEGTALGARMVCRGEADYPRALEDLDDAPPILWMMGQADLIRRPIIAIVGARNASSLGTRMTRALAQGLGEVGFTIVSGLARGVDTAAHLASLDTGTIAVQGGGVDVIYPLENAHLARDIAERGLRISEQPIGLQPQARHFPARNRIISGLAQAVVVVEAAPKSGSLITARAALDPGREVLAVPGHPFDARAGGCNMLIRDGARLVRGIADVIEALPMQAADFAQPALDLRAPPADPTLPMTDPGGHPPRSLRDTAALHSQILQRLGPSPLAEDQLVRDLGTSSSTVAPALTDLELEGKIQRQPGGLLSLASDNGRHPRMS